MALPLFDVLDALFDRQKWSKITAVDKRSSFFMIHRFLSIKYIDHVAMLNLNNISKEKVLDFWNLFLSQNYKIKPGWIYTKSNPSSKKEKSVIDKINKNAIDYFMEKNQLDPRDLESLEKYFPTELVAELKVIQDNL